MAAVETFADLIPTTGETFGTSSCEPWDLILKVGFNSCVYFSGLCETPGEHTNAGEHDPRLGACDCQLEILGNAAAAVEPSQRSFDHPALGLGLEGAEALRSCEHALIDHS